MPSPPRLPLLLATIDAYRALTSAARTAHARAGEDEHQQWIAGLCHKASQALGQAIAAASSGARPWHGFVINWGAGAVAAASAAWVLDLTGVWAWLSITVAVAVGVAAGYGAMAAQVRWRFRVGVKAVNACKIEARIQPGVATAAAVRLARSALVRAKNAFKAQPGAARAYVVWHPLRMVRAEDKVFEAWLHLARAEHACRDRDSSYRWVTIEPGGADTTAVARSVLAARDRLWPVIDDLRRRGAAPELAVGFAALMDAWEILGHTTSDLGLRSPVLDSKWFVRGGLWALPGVAAAAVVGVVAWPVAPAAAVAAAAFIALGATDWASNVVRSRVARRPEVQVQLEALAHPTYPEIAVLQRTWAEAVGEGADVLERLANDLVGDVNGTFDEVRFNESFEQLPTWRQHTIVNLGLAADRLDAARHRIEAWQL